ncbi:Dps family protein [Cellulosilyticum lentocellum]|uniref:Ferritin Dps family protein n=1 Tax=Cellulosilyticum lentocellum (strain ATCC 49066 / DSM 5427 / NCIMB 11756 / RHM5) TaxID=642492 RepID=F2JIV2_CELLD|nr:DNA starvation/stationary phase protection protein [Cellulosilyticum lentocellum]ADZ82024.1 Ferritin Dps family protein [Cellulosilyticum lentocellum DSM 5427]
MKKELALELNRYLANIGVSYVKLHNLHWNIVGKDFKAVHEYLETLYDGFAGVLDSVAELLKMSDCTPAASMKEYLELASIQELASKKIKTTEALAIVLSDIEILKSQAENIRKAAALDDEYAIVSAMEDDLKEYSKTIWFLNAMSK